MVKTVNKIRSESSLPPFPCVEVIIIRNIISSVTGWATPVSFQSFFFFMHVQVNTDFACLCLFYGNKQDDGINVALPVEFTV